MEALATNDYLRSSVADGDGGFDATAFQYCTDPSRTTAPAIRSPGSAFRTFWMGGYEGADHRNSAGVELDFGCATGHCGRAADDYAALGDFGIRTVRESAGWRLIERDGCFDFARLDSRLDAARDCGVQVVWTLCHYGWPDDADIFDDAWIDRFAQYCRAAVRYIADRSTAPPVFTPINEISFLAWAVCETCLIHPHRGGRAGEAYALKRRLVRAAIAGCEAIRDIAPDARILNVDPMIHIVAPADRADLAERAERERSFQFQAWDMLAGHAEPELGGSLRNLDIVGINYYHGNQWEVETQQTLHWHMNDARRVSLRSLIGEAYMRYRAPMIVAETSHVGIGRGAWIREVAHDVATAIADGLPVHGVCLYPVIDRPDWERPDHWHNSGLWDLGPADQGLPRVLCEPYARELATAQRVVRSVLMPVATRAANTSAANDDVEPTRRETWAC